MKGRGDPMQIHFEIKFWKKVYNSISLKLKTKYRATCKVSSWRYRAFSLGGAPPLRKAQGMETSPRKIGVSSPRGATPLKKDAGHGDACIRAPWRFGGAYRSSGMVRVGTRAGPGGTPTGRGPPQPKSLALASGRYRSSTLRFSGCSAPLRPAGVVSRPTRQ